jgi:hypothetical protein
MPAEGPLLWPATSSNAATVDRNLLAFFDAYARKDQKAVPSVTSSQTAPDPDAMSELQYLRRSSPHHAPRLPPPARRERRPRRRGGPGMKRDPLAPVFDEEYLNLVSYELVNQRQGEKAIEVLRLNVDPHPGSANAMDSLSEALELRLQRSGSR